MATNIKEKVEAYLSNLPSEWREKLTKLLCELDESKNKVNCSDVKKCETLTSLSPFSINGTLVSIKYKDEKGVQTTRSFDVSNILNNSLNSLNPGCLTTQLNWNTLTYQQRIQLLIDKHCDCCS